MPPGDLRWHRPPIAVFTLSFPGYRGGRWRPTVKWRGLPVCRDGRLVGYALSSLNDPSVPWHRVINARGEVSLRSGGSEADEVQRLRLEAEGVEFDARGRVDLARYRWRP